MTLFPGEISGASPVCFTELLDRLIQRVRERVRSGEITERGVARATGLSQPHVHNLLKGVRTPSPESADALMRVVAGGLVGLLDLREFANPTVPRTKVALLRGLAGPGLPWVEGLSESGLVLPCRLIAGAADPAALQVTADPEMEIPAGTVILDRSAAGCRIPDPSSIYLVVVAGAGCLRYVHIGRRWTYLATKANLNRPVEWQQVKQPCIPQLIRGRVLAQSLP